jgi:hypothetical protein
MRPKCALNYIAATFAVLLLTFGGRPAAHAADSGFSFAAYGDARTMIYVPYKQEQVAEARHLLAGMFNLVMPQKAAEDLVAKAIQLKYDPDTHELMAIIEPYMSSSEVAHLRVDKGWVTEAAVEDTKLNPGVWFMFYRQMALDWVAREVVKSIQSGHADFAVNAGDIVWWGLQGQTVFDSPYWKKVDKDVLSQLPAPDATMRAAGLEGRWFPAVGNHEVWGDPKIDGVLSAIPYLKKLGVSADKLTYKFDYKDTRFMFLWTGAYNYRQPTAWTATQPSYEDQMKELKQWLDEAKAKGIKKVFLTFHNPVFCRSGMGAIPEAQNPHKLLASYAKDMEVVVFNGHCHTTEIYDVDGVKYLMLGGGGAEQDPILPGRTHIKVPADYPPDLYWNGADPKEDYNYVIVDVKPGQKTKFTLHRCRPWAAEPFATVELFGGSK